MDRQDSSLASRFLEGLGLADISLSSASAKLPAFRKGEQSLRRVAETSDCREALNYLSRLTFPATRHVAFAAGPSTTAFVNNCRNGSDYADYVYHLPRHLACRFARFVCTRPRIWTNGTDREVMSYEARIFDLHDSAGESIRTVTCMDDGGRWVFETRGEALPVESTFPYTARRESDRFTAEHLHELARQCGFSVPDEAAFRDAGYFVLYDVEGVQPFVSCTVEEADDPAYGYYLRGLGWVGHMKTHASSVIHDFERCTRLNPKYEPRVRQYLEVARRHMADDVDH